MKEADDSICGMRERIILFVLAMSLATTSVAKNPAFSSSRISAGGRFHAGHSAFDELPFDDGDVSYALAYEIHEYDAFWQIVLDYAPNISGTNSTTDTVITPQLNLIAKDGVWRGGIGILKSYLRDDDGESNWTDLYWQFILGLELRLFRLEIEAHAYYVFEKWGEVDEFDIDELEFGVWMKYAF